MKKPAQDATDHEPSDPARARRPYVAPRITKRRSIHAGVLASASVSSTQPVVSPPTGD